MYQSAAQCPALAVLRRISVMQRSMHNTMISNTVCINSTLAIPSQHLFLSHEAVSLRRRRGLASPERHTL